MSDPLFVRIPAGMGIELDPASSPECPLYRLVTSSPADILALGHQAVIAITGAVMAAPPAPPAPVQLTAADEMPVGVTDPIEADPPGEWPYRVWAAWCAENGVTQLAAIAAMRKVAYTRGETPPGGLRAIKGRPEYANAVMDLARTTARAAH